MRNSFVATGTLLPCAARVSLFRLSVPCLLSYGVISAIIGTMRQSDSPYLISAFSLLRLATPSLVHESRHGVSWVAAHSMHACHGLRPRGATRPGRCVSDGHGLVFRIDFHQSDSVVLSQLMISGLIPFNLSAYGLHACVLRLESGITPFPSRISYPAAATLPGRDFHPQEYANLPSRTRLPDLVGNAHGTVKQIKRRSKKGLMTK